MNDVMSNYCLYFGTIIDRSYVYSYHTYTAAYVKSGSQYDAGAMSVMGNSSFSLDSNIKIINNMIGWMLANAGNAMPE